MKQHWHNDRLVTSSEPVDGDEFFAQQERPQRRMPRRVRDLAIGGVALALAFVAAEVTFRLGAPGTVASRPINLSLAYVLKFDGEATADTELTEGAFTCEPACEVNGVLVPEGVPAMLAAPAGQTLKIHAFQAGSARVWRVEDR